MKTNKKALDDITNWWVDIDGTVKCGADVVPGAPDAIARMRDKGKVTFVTNVTTSSPKGLCEELRGYGVDCKPEEIYTAGNAAIDWLNENRPGARVVVDGVQEFKDQLGEAGIKLVEERPDLAVMAFNREGNKLCFDEHAYNAIFNGTEFIATHDNPNVPTKPGAMMADTGMLLAGLEKTLGAKARPTVTCGKPYAPMYNGLKGHLGLKGTERVALIGDGSSDMQFAKNYGLKGVFVKTGGMKAEAMVQKGCAPDVVWDSMACFGTESAEEPTTSKSFSMPEVPKFRHVHDHVTLAIRRKMQGGLKQTS